MSRSTVRECVEEAAILVEYLSTVNAKTPVVLRDSRGHVGIGRIYGEEVFSVLLSFSVPVTSSALTVSFCFRRF